MCVTIDICNSNVCNLIFVSTPLYVANRRSLRIANRGTQIISQGEESIEIADLSTYFVYVEILF